MTDPVAITAPALASGARDPAVPAAEALARVPRSRLATLPTPARKLEFLCADALVIFWHTGGQPAVFAAGGQPPSTDRAAQQP
jgi:hypothetical protein